MGKVKVDQRENRTSVNLARTTTHSRSTRVTSGQRYHGWS